VSARALTIASAALPGTYVDARKALAKCDKVDECKTWADKAKALASYAKQMKDTSLEDMAQRIRDRAVRRGGELLLQVKTAQGRAKGIRGSGSPNSRKAAAEKAGLSTGQAKQMVRVANVSEPLFEQMVEAPKPATVEQLADAGTRKSERPQPDPFRNETLDWMHAIAHLAVLPACGLDVLATRPLCISLLDDLKRECAAALENLRTWQTLLENSDVGTKESGTTDREATCAHH
jgi:hypothetical protein